MAPRSAPTVPQLERPCESWDDEVRVLHERLDDFARRDVFGASPSHPAFGALSGRAWGVLGCEHTDHHLRQFGA